MNKENSKKLREAFPILYGECETINPWNPEKGSPPFTPMQGFGFECGDGWFDLIYNLSEQIENYNKTSDHKVISFQVKEKFGSMRFYIGSATDAIFKLIADAEKQSATICEVCGKPGALECLNGWFRTTCEEHRKGELFNWEEDL